MKMLIYVEKIMDCYVLANCHQGMNKVEAAWAIDHLGGIAGMFHEDDLAKMQFLAKQHDWKIEISEG